MPRPAVWMRTPAEGALDLGSKFGVAGRVSRAADQPQEARWSPQSRVRNRGARAVEAGPATLAGSVRAEWRGPARRHERNHALDPLGIVGGDDLRDHAAHRGADDMRAIDFERVHEPDRVARHVFKAVAWPHRQPQSGAGQHRRRLDRPDRRQFRRQAGVAIVEANDAKAPARQALAEIVWPCGELHAEAHDEHHRRAVARPDRFIFDVDGVGSNNSHLGLVNSGADGFRRSAALAARRWEPRRCSERAIAIHLVVRGRR